MEIEGINLYRKFKTGEILPPEGFKFDENDEKMLLRIVLNDFDIELEGGKDGAPVRIKKNGCKRLGLSNHYNLFGALTNEFGPEFAYKAADVHRDWYLNFDLSYICGFMPWILFEDVDEETRELVRKNARLLISRMPKAKNLYELTFSLREYIDRWILSHKEHTTKELEGFVVQTLIDSGAGKYTDIEEFEKKLVKIREDARERARNSVPESTCNCEKNHCREGEADSKLEKYIIDRLFGTVIEKNIGKYRNMDIKKFQEELRDLNKISREMAQKYINELKEKNIL